MRDFFFDTANVDFIKSTMDKYGSDIDPKWVRGVTLISIILTSGWTTLL